MFQNHSSTRDLIPVFRDLMPPAETGRVVWLIERRHWKTIPRLLANGCTYFHADGKWRAAGRIRAATAAEALTDARSRFGPGCRHDDVRVSGISTLGIDDSEK